MLIDEYNSRNMGAKSNNLKELKDKLDDKSVLLP
jgi:hypothetical protein